MADELAALDSYLEEIGRFRPLDDLGERVLIDGLPGTERQVVEGLLGATARVALRLRPPDLTPIHAVQEANIVLLGLVQQPEPAWSRSRLVSTRLEDAIKEHFERLAG